MKKPSFFFLSRMKPNRVRDLLYVGAILNDLFEDCALDVWQRNLLLDTGVINHTLDEDGLGSDLDVDLDDLSLAGDKLDLRHLLS